MKYSEGKVGMKVLVIRERAGRDGHDEKVHTIVHLYEHGSYFRLSGHGWEHYGIWPKHCRKIKPTIII